MIRKFFSLFLVFSFFAPLLIFGTWKIWDKQIKEDSNSGKLDFLAKEALPEKNNDNLKAL